MVSLLSVVLKATGLGRTELPTKISNAFPGTRNDQPQSLVSKATRQRRESLKRQDEVGARIVVTDRSIIEAEHKAGVVVFHALCSFQKIDLKLGHSKVERLRLREGDQTE